MGGQDCQIGLIIWWTGQTGVSDWWAGLSDGGLFISEQDCQVGGY